MSALNEKLADKIYLFDLDGTLANSMPTAVQIVLSFLDERGISYPDDIVQILTPLGFNGAAEYYSKQLGVPLSPEKIFEWFGKKLALAYATEIPLKERVAETLNALKERGVKMCVLTASPHLFTDACLKRTGVYDLFESVWSAEDFGLLKGDTKLYEAVAKKLNVHPSDLVMIDDALNVIKTAKAAGLATVGVYDSYSVKEEAEMLQTADRYVRTLFELL